MFPVWQAFSSSGILHHGQTAQWFSWADAPSFTIHRFLWQFCVRGHQQDPFWESRAAGEMLWGRSHLNKGGFQIERWSRSVMSYSLWPYGLACQAPLSMEFSSKEYWSGLPFPSPGGGSSWPRDQTHVSCIAGRFFTIWATREAYSIQRHFYVLDISKYKRCYGLCLYFPM